MTNPMSLVMRNLSQALKTKTGKSCSDIARKIYGVIIAPSKDFADFLAWFSEEFDKLPKEMKPDWYLGASRGLVGEWIFMQKEKISIRRTDQDEEDMNITREILDGRMAD